MRHLVVCVEVLDLIVIQIPVLKIIRRVACAISGGVDSAVSALILKNRGYQVEGVFMVNWDHVEEGDSSCPRTRDQADAEFVCRKLGIQLHIVNFVKEYWNMVFTDLIQGYQQGHTLVPDIECNRLIKFGLLHDYVRDQLQIDAIATGHYAQNSWGNFLEKPSGPACLRVARDTYKDQTFFLSTLNSEQLKRSMFPVGDLMKPDVKRIAAENGLDELATKRESMGICFVGPKKDFESFLEKYITPKPGPIIEIESGRIVGEHNGIHNYTLGKRVTIDQNIFPNHEGMFVARTDTKSNTLYVCQGSHHPSLYAKSIRVGRVHWISMVPSGNPLKLKFRAQRTHPAVDCELEILDSGEAIVRSRLPIRAAASGQTCVFYDRDICLGSARILDALETL